MATTDMKPRRKTKTRLPIPLPPELRPHARAVLAAADAMVAYRRWQDEVSDLSLPYVRRMAEIRAALRGSLAARQTEVPPAPESEMVQTRRRYNAMIEEVREQMKNALRSHPKPTTGGQIIARVSKHDDSLWCRLVSAAIQVDRIRRGKPEFSEARQ